jgi:hypothetical protein
MYIVPDNFSSSAPPQTKKSARQQAAFRKQLLANRVISKHFESPDRLAGAIAVDLMNLLVERIAREKGVDPKNLVPILENLGHQEPNISPSDIPRRLRERIDAMRAAAAVPLVPSNEGQDIDTVR